MLFPTRVVLTGASAILAAACLDLNGPDLANVSLRVVRLGQTLVDTDSTGGLICGALFLASAKGGEADISVWADSRVLFAFGRDRSKHTTVLTFSAEQVAGGWNADRITGGQQMSAGWTFSAGAPFTVTMEFYYHAPGETSDRRVRTASFTCGPETPADAPPPVVSNVLVEQGPVPLRPGDTLVVHFDLMSPEGLWLSSAAFDGPCKGERAFFDGILERASHTARMALPSTCQVGVPLTVTVTALDVGLEATTVVLPDIVTLAGAGL